MEELFCKRLWICRLDRLLMNDEYPRNTNRDPTAKVFTRRSDIVQVLLCGQELTPGTFPGILAVSAESGCL